MKTDVLIIGAGLSGLLLANKLKRPCLILEKSKGLGGRIATRRVEDQAFDHGAPYLAENPEMWDLLSHHLPEKELSKTHKGLVVRGGMTKFPKDLGKNLEIKKSTRAERIEKTENGWFVTTDTKEQFEASVIILTAPLPQALELLQQSLIPYSSELSTITYDKALMALIITKEGTLPDKEIPSSLHSVEAMASRGLHPRGFVVRMNPKISEENFDKSDAHNLDHLVEEFKKSFSVMPEIEYQEFKKWRYVIPQKAISHPFIEVSKGLFLIGDSFTSPDTQGAIHSASLLAEKLNLAF